jgi:predicted pyridoxine 5'-phosphate oxidase superfamily flavin-nucleotide-binding protein
MARRYLNEMLTGEVRAEEERYYGRAFEVDPTPDRDPLGEDEAEFIARRDSFYLATVASGGWPYIQHRGGPPGFLKVLDAHRLAFPDYRGNRQLISAGNIAGEERVSLFLMDYPRRERLKILGLAKVLDAKSHRDVIERVATSETKRKTERVIVIDVVSYDWNCPAYITPRYTEAEIREAMKAGAFR